MLKYEHVNGVVPGAEHIFRRSRDRDSYGVC